MASAGWLWFGSVLSSFQDLGKGISPYLEYCSFCDRRKRENGKPCMGPWSFWWEMIHITSVHISWLKQLPWSCLSSIEQWHGRGRMNIDEQYNREGLWIWANNAIYHKAHPAFVGDRSYPIIHSINIYQNSLLALTPISENYWSAFFHCRISRISYKWNYTACSLSYLAFSRKPVLCWGYENNL